MPEKDPAPKQEKDLEVPPDPVDDAPEEAAAPDEVDDAAAGTAEDSAAVEEASDETQPDGDAEEQSDEAPQDADDVRAEESAADGTAAEDTADGDTADGDTADGDTADGDAAAADAADGETAGETAVAEESGEEPAAEDTPDEADDDVVPEGADEPGADAAQGDDRDGSSADDVEASSTDGATAEEPAAEEPADDEPAGDEPADEEPVGEKPAAEDPADDEPATPTAPPADEDEDEERPAEATDEATEPEEGPTGRQRLVEALVHVRRGQAIVAALLCVLGFAAVLQVRTNDEDNSYNGQREQDLIDIFSGLAGTTQKAQEQLESLQSTRSRLQHETSKQQAALDRSKEQVDTLRVVAGTTPVHGPGIVITIEPGADELRLTPILDVVEELRSNGAEAIDFNGKARLVASSAIEVSESVQGLNIEGELVRPPYKIHVIGDPDTLESAIDFFRGPKDELEAEGAKVHISTSENVEIKTVHTPSH